MKRSKPMKRTQMKRRSVVVPSPMSAEERKHSKKPPTKSKKRKSPKRKTKYALRERDIPYMLWVKTLPCLFTDNRIAGPCSGVVEADHAGLDSGIGAKAPDDTCVPLCSRHHLDRHAATGFFRWREKEETLDECKAKIRAWRLAAIENTQAQHAGAASFDRVAF